jgi:hypothetical protein
MDENIIYSVMLMNQFCELKLNRELTDDENDYIIRILRYKKFDQNAKTYATIGRYLVDHFESPHFDIMPVLQNTVFRYPDGEMYDYNISQLYSDGYSLADKSDRYFNVRPVKWQTDLEEAPISESKVVNANLVSRSPIQKKPTIESMIKSIYGIIDSHLFQRIFIPTSQYKYVYVLLDTSTALNVGDQGTSFQWNFIDNVHIQDGVVTTVGKVRDLVAMRCFPVKANYDLTTGLPPKHYNNFVNLNNNFTILIEEFSAQSYIGRDGRRFHFVLFPVLMNPVYIGDVTISPDDPYYEYVTTGKSNGWFYFRTPIVSFSNLTVSMADPFGLIKLSNTVRTLIPLMLVYLNDTDQEK